MPNSRTRSPWGWRPATVVVLTVFLAACGSDTPQTPPSFSPSTAAAPSVQPSSTQPPDVQTPSGQTPAEAPSDPPSSAPAQSDAPPADTGTTAGESPQGWAAQVSEPSAFVHLEALQRIADQNGGNRASPSAGYDGSVDYVVGVLRDAGYQVDTPTYTDDGAEMRNVITQTNSGDPATVVMIGAHLDSVEEGPGIVDDGSGVAVLLEIATRMAASPPTQNAVRFAFFGSEEQGAVGSTAYVENLSTDERSKITLYLNVDMVASPNAGYLIQGGQGSDLSEAGPPGSATVAQALADELAKTGVTAETIEFVGDDETPFIAAGIPSGGAENGDADEKSSEQALASGGQAGEVFDPCYHEACDTLNNVNRDVLDHYLRAIAGTIAHFAASTESLPDR